MRGCVPDAQDRPLAAGGPDAEAAAAVATPSAMANYPTPPDVPAAAATTVFSRSGDEAANALRMLRGSTNAQPARAIPTRGCPLSVPQGWVLISLTTRQTTTIPATTGI